METESLPSAIDAEESLIGAMLLQNSSIPEVMDKLTKDDFYDPRHGILFDEIVNVYRIEGAVDTVVLSDSLRQRKMMEQAGGLIYIMQLASSVATAGNIRLHARIIRERKLSRMLINHYRQYSEKALQLESPETLSEDTIRFCLNQITDEKAEFERLGSVSEEVYETALKAQERESKWAGIDSGFIDLNNGLNGLCEGEFTIIAARPAMGKTRLAMQIGHYVAASGQAEVAVFSLEMLQSQLYQYLACMQAGINLTAFRAGELEISDWHKFTGCRTEIDRLPIYVDDSSPLTIEELYARTERLLSVHPNVRLVIIDYLQLMAGPGNSANEKFDLISQGLKNYKKRYPVHLLVLSQLSRLVEQRHERRPQLSDLRDSGAIEQNVDNALFLYRPGFYDHLRRAQSTQEEIDELCRKAELLGEKLRFGAPCDIPLIWQADKACFAQRAPDYRDEAINQTPAKEEDYERYRRQGL